MTSKLAQGQREESFRAGEAKLIGSKMVTVFNMLKYSQITLALFLSLYLTLFCTEAFIPPTHKLAFARSKNACGPAHAKGFSKEEKMASKPKTEGAIKREAERSKYDDLSSTGGQEVRLPKEEMKEADCIDPESLAHHPPLSNPFSPPLSLLPYSTQFLSDYLGRTTTSGSLLVL